MTVGQLLRLGVGGAGASYSDKVLGYGPIAYWPLWEAAGATAECLVDSPAQDGTYVGVTLGQTGIGDGNTCPLFDGANDYVDQLSAALAGVFDGNEGTILAWTKVFDAGVWTDGLVRRAFCFAADGLNIQYLTKDDVNNAFWYRRKGGNVASLVIEGGLASTDWIVYGMTYSLSTGLTGEMRAYRNGLQIGLTQVNLGTWAGGLADWSTVIGAGSEAPDFPWHGYLAHCMVFDRALPQPTILDLATV